MGEEYVKRLDEWAVFKSKLENRHHNPPFFKEGEVWWCHIGENIGIESSGKHEEFTRPVFIFKKYDRYSFLGLSLTTKQKVGSWYVPITFNGISQTVVLAQGKTMDHRRLKEKIGELGEDEWKEIIDAYWKLHIRGIKPFLTGRATNQLIRLHSDVAKEMILSHAPYRSCTPFGSISRFARNELKRSCESFAFSPRLP
jgi:mRNA interferase MazF